MRFEVVVEEKENLFVPGFNLGSIASTPAPTTSSTATTVVTATTTASKGLGGIDTTVPTSGEKHFYLFF